MELLVPDPTSTRLPRTLGAPSVGGLLALLLPASSAWAGTITVTTAADVVNSADRLCSLREAAETLAGASVDATCVEVASSGDVIQLGASTYCLSSTLDLVSSLTVRGAASGTTTLDGGNGSTHTCGARSGQRVLSIDDGLAVTLDRVTVRGGYSTQGGAGVLASSSVSLTITDSVIRDNLVEGAGSLSVGGGGIYLGTSGDLFASGSSFLDNEVSCPERMIGKCARGGALHAEEGSTVELEDSVVDGNVVGAVYDAARGGGIYLTSSVSAPSNLLLTRTTVSNNSATGGGPSGALGGGVGTEDCGTLTLDESVLDGNAVEATGARAFGAGLAATFCDAVDLVGTTVRGNANLTRASGVGAYGGGVYLGSNGEVTLTASTFSDNEAVHSATSAESAYGGGVYLFESPSTLLNVTVSGNRAIADGSAYGGGIFTKGTIRAYLVHTTVADNAASGGSAAYGGGVSHFPSGSSGSREEQVVLLNSVFSGNTSTGPTAKGADCYEKTYTLGHNVLSTDSDCYFDTSLATGTVVDQVDVSPLLSALTDNGGPVETRALSASSPARAAANCLDWTGSPVTTDARGTRRDRRCDAGAWEYGDRRSPPRSATSGGRPDVLWGLDVDMGDPDARHLDPAAGLDGLGADADGEGVAAVGWGCSTTSPVGALGTLVFLGLVTSASRRRPIVG